MSVVVLDTDVASSLLRRRTSDAVAARLAGQVAAVTFVTVGELTKWTLVRHWAPRNVAAMRDFLSQLLVLPYDQRVAAQWGDLQAGGQLRGLRRARRTDARPPLSAAAFRLAAFSPLRPAGLEPYARTGEPGFRSW